VLAAIHLVVLVLAASLIVPLACLALSSVNLDASRVRATVRVARVAQFALNVKLNTLLPAKVDAFSVQASALDAIALT